MANIIQIKHGASTPTVNNLSNYELGWDTVNKTLYIKDNDTIRQVIPSIPVASTSVNGLMTAADKVKLDGIATGATANVGTVTSVGVKMNGTTKGTITSSGTIDLGTVITAHQSLSGYVPTSRTINSKALSSNISLTASDVSALALSGGTMSGDITISKTSGYLGIALQKTSPNRDVRFEIASGGNGYPAGIYDNDNAKWIIRSDNNTDLQLQTAANTGDTYTPIYIDANGRFQPTGFKCIDVAMAAVSSKTFTSVARGSGLLFIYSGNVASRTGIYFVNFGTTTSYFFSNPILTSGIATITQVSGTYSFTLSVNGSAAANACFIPLHGTWTIS